MKHIEKRSGLNCMFGGPNRGGGGRSKIPFQTEIEPIHEKTLVFSLVHACLASGLIDPKLSNKKALSWTEMSQFAISKWDRSVEKFFLDAQRVCVTKTSIAEATAGIHGAVIGWTCADGNHFHQSAGNRGICSDLNFTLAVLSCRIADLFIPYREPDFSWETLFGSCFEIDEALSPAPEILKAPLDQFQR